MCLHGYLTLGQNCYPTKIYVTLNVFLFTLQCFKFTAACLAKVVAPGLSVSCVLKFTPVKEEEVRGFLLVDVEDEGTIEIPLLG